MTPFSIVLFVIRLKNFRIEHAIPQSWHFTSRPYLLALTSAIASSIYSVIDQVGVQRVHPVFYI